MRRALVTLGAQALKLVDLPRAHRRGVDLQHAEIPLDRRRIDVDADHGLAARIDARLGACGGFFDAALRHAALDRLRHAAKALDLIDVALRPLSEVGGQTFEIIRAAPGVDDPGRAAFFDQKELGVAGDPGGEGRGQRQRLIERVGMQRLGMALGGGHRLDLGAHDVVEGVLCGQRPAGRLAVRPEGERPVRCRSEALDKAGPELARGAELGDLHEKIHAHRPEERQPRREGVDAHSGADAGAQIFDAVGERIGEFEILRRARFLHVIAGDRDRVEFRHVGRGEREDVGDDPHRGGGRINVSVADHELFQDVVLNGA